MKINTNSINFSGLLTIVFIVLKLTDYIHWSWWWVLSPLWISAAIAVFFIVIILLFLILSAIYGKK